MGFTSGYSPFVGGDLVTWRSKKQNVLSCSSTEAKYRTMAHTTCELMWSKNFMSEIGCPLLLLCLCGVKIKLPSILLLSLYFMRVILDTPFVFSSRQLAEIFHRGAANWSV